MTSAKKIPYLFFLDEDAYWSAVSNPELAEKVINISLRRITKKSFVSPEQTKISQAVET